MADAIPNPGYKSSEFWVGVVVALVTILNQSGVLGSFQLPLDAIHNIAALAITYIASRTALKAVTVNAAK